ncbi:hypothetical protein [Acinetobacter terrae]|uniref:Oligosaccharide repeat unit polymerase n=1 Tax=Acinetobacter terrae TaxID=2731247 RepID=A0A4R0EMN2_9GAMM|nr:hypothetical protein [Acinetobacter terrae]TCB59685.1 hypothetical protein E0H85_07630 [Acinetobacter terrae]
MLKTRLVYFILSIIYSISLYLVNEKYLSQNQYFWGFDFKPLDFFSVLYIFLFIFIFCLFKSLSISTPARLIIFVLYVVVIIPSNVLISSIRGTVFSEYFYLLTFMNLGFLINIIILSYFSRPSISAQNLPNKKIDFTFFVLWSFCFILLIFFFHDVINFVSLEETYTQREAGRSGNALEAYLQTYFPNLICTYILITGLIKRNKLLIFIAFSGYILMYGIAAQRTVFLMPFIICFLYYFLNKSRYSFKPIGYLISILSLVFLLVGYVFSGAVKAFFGFYIVTRIIGFPGIMIAIYYDVFNSLSYTYWSHIKGFSSFVDVPPELKNYEQWPQLGYVVSDYKYGVVSNTNANFYAMDGVASIGSLGILFISIILLIYLLILDYAAKNVDYRFSIVLVFPMSLALTNASLFIVLMSFGGILISLLFYYIGNVRVR